MKILVFLIILSTSVAQAGFLDKVFNPICPKRHGQLLQDISENPKFKMYQSLLESEPVKKKGVLRKELERNKLNYEIPILGFDILEGLSFSGLVYGFSLRPSYIDSQFLRRDSWSSSLKYTKSKSIGTAEGVSITATPTEVELLFERQYPNDSWFKALNPKRILCPNAFPEKVKEFEEMDKGQFMALSVNSKIGFSYSKSKISKWLAKHIIRLSAAYGNTGSMRIYVYKKDKHHVRIKAMAVRASSKGIYLTGSFVDDATHFKNDFLNNEIGNELNDDYQKSLKFLKFDLYSVSKQDIVLADYLLDLRNDDVVKAYEDFIENAQISFLKLLKNTAISLIDDLRDQNLEQLKTYRDDLDPFVMPLEDVREKYKGSEFPPIYRKYFGTSLSKTRSFYRIDLNFLIFLNFDTSKYGFRNYFAIKNDSEKFNYYKYTGQYSRDYGEAWFSRTWSFDHREEYNVASEVTANQKSKKLLYIIKKSFVNETDLSVKEQIKLFKNFEEDLPLEVYTHLMSELPDMVFDKKNKENFRMNYQLYLFPEAIHILRYMNANILNDKLKKFIRSNRYMWDMSPVMNDHGREKLDYKTKMQKKFVVDMTNLMNIRSNWITVSKYLEDSKNMPMINNFLLKTVTEFVYKHHLNIRDYIYFKAQFYDSDYRLRKDIEFGKVSKKRQDFINTIIELRAVVANSSSYDLR